MLTAAFAAFRLAEVDAAGQFAYAENVEAVSSDVGAQRAELFQPLIQFGRAQVAEQFKVFTQRQQRATLWLFRRRQVLPFRTADGAEQDRIRLLASGDGRLRQGSSLTVDGRPPTSYWLVVMCMAKRWRTASSTFIAWFITSGPMPSPGKTAIW